VCRLTAGGADSLVALLKKAKISELSLQMNDLKDDGIVKVRLLAPLPGRRVEHSFHLVSLLNPPFILSSNHLQLLRGRALLSSEMLD
jgi:hypothetical protein